MVLAGALWFASCGPDDIDSGKDVITDTEAEIPEPDVNDLADVSRAESYVGEVAPDLPVDIEPELSRVETVDEKEEELIDLGPGILKKVQGTVVDGDGQPVSGLFVQPCTYTETGESCHKTSSKTDGSWELSFDPPKEIVGLHVRFVDDAYTPLICHYDLDELSMEFNVVDFKVPFVLFDMPETVTVPVGTADPVEISADGLAVTLPPEVLADVLWEDTMIRVRAFPLDVMTPCFFEPDNAPDALYASTPDWIGFATPGGLEVRFANTKGLAPGEKVNLFVVGGFGTVVHPLEGDPIPIPVGTVHELGTGTVSEDGSKIVSDPGTGMPGLGWLGWKTQ